MGHSPSLPDVPPKRRFTQDLHGATLRKTAFFPDSVSKILLVFIHWWEMQTYLYGTFLCEVAYTTLFSRMDEVLAVLLHDSNLTV
jgi:hypothetical protein